MSPGPARAGAIWLLGLCLPLAGGCADRQAPAPPAVLAVFAASSLTEAFEDLARAFERSQPGIAVELSFAGSQVLRLQIEQGAGADVFASANEEYMRALTEGGLVGPSRIFAHNELVIVVPASNPAAIESLADLDRARRLVIGTDRVPVGIYTRQLFDRAATRFGAAFAARLRGRVVSEESNVRLVRAKVELGEADAAIVYRTDALASDRVRRIDIPAEIDPRASYPIAAVARSARAAAARRFIAFVLSAPGQAILARHGFTPAAR